MRFSFLTITFFSLVFCLNCQADKLSDTHTNRISHIYEAQIPPDLVSNLIQRIGKKNFFQQINRNIHRLMNLGIFDNVIVTANTTNDYPDVSYSFIEAPVVSAWTNKIYSCSVMPDDLSLKSMAGKHFNHSDWFNDKIKIEKFYREHNYNYISVSSHVYKIEDQNKVILTTEVYPGTKQFVEGIKITGINDYEKEEIKNMIHCKPRNLWMFRKGEYSIDKLQKDEKNIRSFFVDSGFLDAEVEVSVTNSSSKERVIINVKVIKGPIYRLGTLIWNQQLLSSNDFVGLENKLAFSENTAYTPDYPDIIRRQINTFCINISPQLPNLTIIPLINQQSTPYNPIVDIIIILRKGYSVHSNPASAASTFSYPASLAREYLNKF
ncbi:hypothetical protein KAH27_05450 [bacterium]|nr:hypothetical protein [bacterium]